MFKFVAVAALSLGLVGQARADDLIAVKSALPVHATLNQLHKIVTGDGFFIVARVPHSGAAKGAGLTLRPPDRFCGSATSVFGDRFERCCALDISPLESQPLLIGNRSGDRRCPGINRQWNSL